MGYVTISESIRQNGNRHKANAERYAALGLAGHAAGSMRKAERNYRRAAELDALSEIPEYLQTAHEALLKAIEIGLLGGSGQNDL